MQEFELAWERRYFDGLQLLTSSDNERTAGAVYMLGYVAEMILKTAYFRFMGAGSNDLVSSLMYTDNFKAARRDLGVDSENNHSLSFWAEMLLDKRKRKRRPLEKLFEQDFRNRVQVLHSIWRVEIRYHALVPDTREWQDVLDCVGWLRKHQSRLWR